MSASAFVITTWCANEQHIQYLTSCLQSIVQHLPAHHIYVLDDGPIPVDDVISSVGSPDITLCRKEFEGAGELNPYFFAVSKDCKHSRLVYLHDSVCVQAGFAELIRANESSEVCTLWNASKYIHTDIWEADNKPILNTLTINGVSVADLFVKHKHDLFVTFGAMTIFDKSFAEKILAHSNLRSVAPLFKKKVNRCLFERLMSLFILELYPNTDIPLLLGDIFGHPKAFRNSDPNVCPPLPAIKMWAGR